MSKLTINSTAIETAVQQTAQSKFPTKMSQLTNDSGYVTASGSVDSVSTATNTSRITGGSGVSAGTYGAGGNVTVGNKGSGSISIPYFTVNAQGRVTASYNRTLYINTHCNDCSHCSYTCSYCSNCDCQP